MEVKIEPTQDREKLCENLEKRVSEIHAEDEQLVAEIEEEKLSMLERTPGVKQYRTPEDEVEEGLEGRPVQEEAYAKLESKRDLARAVVATIDGYDLRILHTSNEWDLRVLRRFNPDVKHLKIDEPSEILGIEKTLEKENEELEQVEVDLAEDEVEMTYRFAQPSGKQD